MVFDSNISAIFSAPSDRMKLLDTFCKRNKVVYSLLAIALIKSKPFITKIQLATANNRKHRRGGVTLCDICCSHAHTVMIKGMYI